MANSILKLKVESEEYDAKLKKAAEGIRHLAEVAHKGGSEMTGLEKSELDFIKALGDMETKSRTAAGSTRELENAFKELSVIYNQLNDVEKADEGGKALAASLETLKQRAIDARAQMDNATQSLKTNESAGQQDSSMLEQLASKFTINLDAVKLFNFGLQALDVALGVVKDAFFSSETNVDEWGRTVESAKGVYEGFLQSINTGDISGFLNNIGQITTAAREAYNALDELGTRQTILNPERAKLQARSTELKATIRREGADSAAGKAAAAELKALEKPLTEAWKTESKLNRDAFTALVKERLAEGGINLNQKSFNQFMKTFSSDAAFQQLKGNARGSLTTGTYSKAGITATKTTDTRNTEQKLMDLFTDEWRKQYSGLLSASYNAMGSAASTMLSDARYLKGGKGGSGGSGRSGGAGGSKTEQTELQQNQAKINKLTQEYVTLGDQATEAARERQAEIQREIELLKKRNGLLELRKSQAEGRMLPGAGDFQRDGLSVSGGLFNPYADDNKKRSLGLQLDKDTMKKVDTNIAKELAKDGENVAQSWKKATSAISQVGGALQRIEDPGLKVAGIIMEAIASVVEGFATASSKEGEKGIWYWIAATAAGLATMISTISSIHSATGYAQGGIVKGNSYSGDNIPADSFVNAGELVLNKAQQNNLAMALSGGGMQHLNLTATLKGEDLRLSLKANGQRTGRGEYVTTNFR